MRTTLAALAVLAGVLSLPSSAHADPSKKTNAYEYVFSDDSLLAPERGAAGTTIHVIPLGRRDALLRPRIQFVSEMLKSVENM